MTIGIDGRLMGETGVGRYIRNLIHELSVIDKVNRYIIFLRNDAYQAFALPNDRWEKRLANVAWHSVTEQIMLPKLFVKEKLDLIHVPYFNVPLLYTGKFIVTIHDLTMLHFDTGKATTMPMPFYWIKRLGYMISLWSSVLRSEKIITVSESTKKEVIDHFHINPKKIIVTYEGIDKTFESRNTNLESKKRIITDPYFLYVGNAYPHKNLELLLHAFQTLVQQPEKASPFEAKLVLVGKDDFFYKKIRKLVHTLNLDENIVLFGHATDTELSSLYFHALALVFPSRMEGFGLPAIEALSFGCPVICSDIPVFHELLNDLPMYFHSTNAEDLLHKMKDVLSDHYNNIYYHSELRKKSLRRFQDYTWRKLAEATLSEYLKI